MFSSVGFDTANAKWDLFGTPETRISTTWLEDIGLAVASLTHIAITKPEVTPDYVRLSGQSVSLQEARDIFSAAKGIDIVVTYLDDAELKKSVIAAHATTTMSDPAWCVLNDLKYVIFQALFVCSNSYASTHIRLAISTGLMDNRENENELVNPGESLWKWKTISDYANAQA